ncbi:metal-dependent hydrolase [Halorubellus sp. JP-L1]|uniref:metal-dependent hydrolase n=1 Tax=Halorubellus sp. JP-L1 TaxID=2715753 RepID=UPI00140D3D8B|nr:metal-dependent hydrolase [Halorubellus sp. JP-L1]
MYQLGHYGVSLLLYAPVGLALAFGDEGWLAVLGGAGVLAVATLPDVDHRIPGVRHRGVTHTVPFAVLVGVAFAGGVLALCQAGSDPLPATELVGSVAFAFAVGTFGVLAHLAGDALTPMGVPVLWPLSDRRYTVSLTRADSPLWNVLLFALGVLATATAGYLAVQVG